jgi:hypothetical protein
VIETNPNEIRALHRLERADLVRVGLDHSVQLRLDGADAPELHYQGVAQPRALAARDLLLRWLGFRRLVWGPGFHCRRSEPRSVDVAIAASSVDIHGWPISYLFRAADLDAVRAQAGHRDVATELLRQRDPHSHVANKTTSEQLVG